MPIADVTLVGPFTEHDRAPAQRLADALGDALGAPRGTAWVRVHRVEADDYAESGGAPAGLRPVFVELLQRAWPADEGARAASLRAVAEAVAGVCQRPVADVHVVSEVPAAGRVAFGGERVPAAERARATTGARWEAIVGYSRAVRAGDLVFVTGTTALVPGGGYVAADDAYGQARQCFENVLRALAALGAEGRHVTRTRMFVTDIARDWEAIGRAHAEAFGEVRPATTMVEVRALIEPWMRVEVEADAVVG